MLKATAQASISGVCPSGVGTFTLTPLEQEVHDGIMSNVGGIHQRGPATTVLLIQI